MMLLAGTCTTVVQKFVLEQKGTGRSIYPPHRFAKPWFFTLVMFVGELTALIFYKLQLHYAGAHLNLDGLLDSKEPVKKMRMSHIFFILALPSLCDLVASAIMSVGLLYVQASFWTMLRGAQVVFSAVLHAFVLKRKQKAHMWFGVLIVTLALVIVGLSAVCASGVAAVGASHAKVLLAVFLTVGSQLIRAVQVILEDHFLHDIDISPFLIVGMEGFWGIIGTVCIFMPAVQFIPGDEGNGVHEDTWDTLLMIKNNPTTLAWLVLVLLSIFGLNLFGMLITEFTNAVMRTIIESMRAFCIWVIEIIIYYSINNLEYGHHHPEIGEEWTKWSWMELTGFALLITGLLVYSASVRLPLNYDEDDSSTQSDQGTNNFEMMP
jgi:drug/metabolite transporter (DMT)-like permease